MGFAMSTHAMATPVSGSWILRVDTLYSKNDKSVTREVGLKCYSNVKLFKAQEIDWVKLVAIYQNLSTLDVKMASQC